MVGIERVNAKGQKYYILFPLSTLIMTHGNLSSTRHDICAYLNNWQKQKEIDNKIVFVEFI